MWFVLRPSCLTAFNYTDFTYLLMLTLHCPLKIIDYCFSSFSAWPNVESPWLIFPNLWINPISSHVSFILLSVPFTLLFLSLYFLFLSLFLFLLPVFHIFFACAKIALWSFFSLDLCENHDWFIIQIDLLYSYIC